MKKLLFVIAVTAMFSAMTMSCTDELKCTEFSSISGFDLDSCSLEFGSVVSDVTDRLEFELDCQKSSLNIEIGGMSTSGDLDIIVYDGSGDEVFNRGINFITGLDQSLNGLNLGKKTIVLDFQCFSGNIGIDISSQ